MSKRPWFAFYTGDFERKTKHLSAHSTGAYVRLMISYWDNNGHLIYDPPGLCRIMGIDRRRFAATWGDVKHFFVSSKLEVGDTLLLPRMQEELEKTIAISKAKAVSGKRGGQASAVANTQAKPHTLTHTLTKTKKEQGKPRKKRATSLTDKWVLPDDYRDYCKTKRPDLNPDVVAENFHEYYLSHGKAMVDWKMTWQRWVRKEHGVKKAGYEKPDVQSQSFKKFDPDAKVEIAPGVHPYEEQSA